MTNTDMTDKLSEDAIEQFAIELLQAQGYHYLHGPAKRHHPHPKNWRYTLS